MAKMKDCNCGPSRKTVVWRVEREGENPVEFANQADAEKYDRDKGGGGDIHPVSK